MFGAIEVAGGKLEVARVSELIKRELKLRYGATSATNP
jgi:hypothetical protein